MAPQVEFLDILIETVEKNCSLGTSISLKELKSNGGIYAELGDGFTESVYYNKQTVKSIPVLFLCRNKDQRQCIDWLFSITNYLQRLKKYPTGKTFWWLDAEISKEPSKIGRDEDGVYHFSSIINCKIHY